MAEEMKLITDITLELTGETKRYEVVAKQGDKATRFVRITLKNNGQDFEIPAGMKVIANIQKPDRKRCYNKCSYSGNKVTMELTNQALAVAGTAECDIEIREANDAQVLSSQAFTIEIEKSVRDEKMIESSNEFTELEQKFQDQLKEIEDIKKNVDEAVENYLNENPVQPTPIDSSLTKEGEAADAKKTGDELNKRLIAPADNGTEGQVLSKDADGNNIWKTDELKDKSVTMNKTDFLSAKEAFNFIEQYRDTFNSWNYNTFPLLDTMPKDNVEFWVVTTENKQNGSGVQCVIYFEDYRNVNTVPVEKTQITVDDTTYYIRHWKFSYNHDVCKRWGFGNNVKLDTSQIVYWTDTPVDEEFLRNNGKTYSSNADFKKIVSDITNEQMEGIKKEVLDSANDEIAGMAIKINPIYGKHIWMIGDSNTQYNLSGIQSLFKDEYGCTFTSYATAGYPWGTENGENTTDNSAVGQINRICSQAENLESEAFSEDSHIFLFMMGTNATSGGSGSEATAEDVSTCYGAMNYCFRKISRYARVGNAVGVIIPLEINTTDKENQIALCKKYAIPYIDLMTEARIYQDNGANYITDGGNHMAGNGMMHWKRIVGKWVAYRI